MLLAGVQASGANGSVRMTGLAPRNTPTQRSNFSRCLLNFVCYIVNVLGAFAGGEHEWR